MNTSFHNTTALHALALALACGLGAPVLAQSVITSDNKHSWGENTGWMNWADAGAGAQSVLIEPAFLSGYIWCENIGWISLGDGSPADGVAYSNTTGADFGVNHDANTGYLSGLGWGENIGWINFSAGGMATPAIPARIVVDAPRRLYGYAWSENTGWINLDDSTHYVGVTAGCGTADYDGDGDTGTDLDIEAFFACLGGNCCNNCTADFDADGDTGTDLDIEAFFRVLGGNPC